MKTVTIYTDGACSGNPGPGGWGAILEWNGVEKELSGGAADTTNNRMELTGVIRALSCLKEPCVVELYSDSKYVIDALSKGWVYGWKKKGWIKSDKKPALNVDLWQELLPLIARHEVHYHWVKGHEENEKPRMVKSPWFDEEVPFDLAAETGTRRVIREHSTIGIVITTDGTVSDIPRAGYAKTEKRVIEELDALGKPYVILLNSTRPDAPETKQLAEGMARDYHHAVLPVSCVDLDAAALGDILRQVLYEFPVRELDLALPRWVNRLENGHWLQAQVYTAAMQLAENIARMKDVPSGTDGPLLDCDAVQRSAVSGMDLAQGSVRVVVELKPEIFYQVLSEQTGLEIGDEAGLMPCILELAHAKREYEKVRSALEQVEATGYGIVMPSVEELNLEDPEIVRQGGRYGVRMKASAPSIHMIRADIETVVSPIVGNEKQSEDMVNYLMQEFEGDTSKIWNSNIFGRSFHEIVEEDLQAKLKRMPESAQKKLREALGRIINEGGGGLICIIL